MEELQLDPIRQIRAAKIWAFAGIVWAIVILMASYTVTLDLSTMQMVYVVAPAAAVAAVFIELAARWEARTHRRYAYPHRLGYELALIHDFERACDTSARMIGEWLDLDAVVVAWLSDDDEEVCPVSAYGMPAGWVHPLRTIPAEAAGITGDKISPSNVLTRKATDDPWFGASHAKDLVIYVPLVSRDIPEGVLAVCARKRNPQIGDRRLLAALGMVLGLSLDNCRLYEGQRAHAQHFQELHRMKTDFLTTISHELRTPLTSIMMGAEMLLEDEETRDPGSTRGKLVRNIVKGASRMKSLVEDLVAISREDSVAPRLEMETGVLADPINNAVSIVQPLLTAKHQTFDLEMSDPSAQARIDRLRFEQVLINLLSNAQRYTPPGGHVSLATTRTDSGETMIAVTDSGPGVAPEDAEMIFEPFYRGDRSGLGLGLAIAKSIVELHSGRIWVEPAEGHGSRFCVTLPAEAVARKTVALQIPVLEPTADRRTPTHSRN